MNIEPMFVADASRIQGDVYDIMRVRGRVSALIKKDVLPQGMGFNFSTPVTQRSQRTGGSGWVAVQPEEGDGNNCAPTPGTTTSAIDLLTWSAYKRVETSDTICLDDAWSSYDFKSQVRNKRSQFIQTIVDLWEDRDKAQFIANAGHKIIFDSSLTSGSGATLPGAEADYQINQNLLDTLYTQIIQDGGGEEAYAFKNAAPQLPLITSSEGHRTIIKVDSSTREDFRFADQGKGEGATLLKNWNVDGSYGGYMHVIDNKMPRYNFVDGAYVEVPFYTTAAATIGTKLILNPAYVNAGYEAAFIWHPDVVHRMVPKAVSSVGADTSFGGYNYNGQVIWRNPDVNLDGTINLMKNMGYWASQLYAAYKPIKVQYGYVIIWKRCPQVTGSGCTY